MSAKRISLVATLVVVLATGLFLRGQLLSTNDNDLMHHFDAWSADQFNDPMPGKAYAFYADESKFDPSAVCVMEAAPDEKPERVQGINLAGESYNDALNGFNGIIGDTIIGLVRVDTTRQDWALAKLYQEGVEPKLAQDCLQDIDTMMMLKPDLIFVVDTVYYRSGEKTPFLVKFKRNPFVFSCEDDCGQGEDLTLEVRSNRFTKLKFKWDIIRFLRREPDAEAAV